jgi:hypothetical protein
MIESAFIIRNASDYDDMFIASKDVTATSMMICIVLSTWKISTGTTNK